MTDSETSPLLNAKTVPDSYESTGRTTARRGALFFTCGYASKDKEKIKRRVQFGLLATLVVFLYIAKGVLLISRYVQPLLHKNDTIAVEGDDSPELQSTATGSSSYYFTVGVYAIVAFMRCIEYIPLFHRIYRFYMARSKCKHKFHFKKDLFHCTDLQCSLIYILLPLELFFALSIAPVGVAVEYTHAKEEHCNNPWTFGFYVYCFLNIFRYIWSFTVRAGMVVTTLKIREVWKNVPSTETKPVSTDQNLLEMETIEPTQNTGPIHETAVAQHARLTSEYTEAGKNVKILANIFQTWFLIPWIIIALESYLEVSNLLTPWKENKEKIKILPVVYLLLFNINQLIFLLIPYICGQKMNHYHHQCQVRIQEMQLSPTKNDDELAQARKLLIQQEDDFDFVPRFWGLGFKVKMNSMIYIIFLLLGFFFTAYSAMV